MRIAWLDTMRVLASLLVIFSHYAYVAGKSPSVQNFFETYIFHIGEIGVIIFFAVSGYLAANSLEHSKSILEFYRRKLIRIFVPFAVAYIFLSVLFLLLGIFNLQIAEHSPMYRLFHQGGSANAFLIGMFPISSDDNITSYFHLPNYRLVGEWFIGTIVWLYLISPLIYKGLKKNLLLTIAILAVVAILVFKFVKVPSPHTFFIVRIPEFSFGMILFFLKDFISNHKNQVTKIIAILGIILIGYGLYFNEDTKNLLTKIIFGTPLNLIQYLYAAAIINYFAYFLAQYLNERFEKFMTKFNSFSIISYVAMLIHHVVIFRLNDIYHFTNLTKSGVVFFFLFVLFTTIFLSEQIHKVYKPLEEKLIKGRLFIEQDSKFK